MHSPSPSFLASHNSLKKAKRGLKWCCKERFNLQDIVPKSPVLPYVPNHSVHVVVSRFWRGRLSQWWAMMRGWGMQCERPDFHAHPWKWESTFSFDVPANGMGLRTSWSLRSFPTPTVLWDHNSMILWFISPSFPYVHVIHVFNLPCMQNYACKCLCWSRITQPWRTGENKINQNIQLPHLHVSRAAFSIGS